MSGYSQRMVRRGLRTGSGVLKPPSRSHDIMPMRAKLWLMIGLGDGWMGLMGARPLATNPTFAIESAESRPRPLSPQAAKRKMQESWHAYSSSMMNLRISSS